MNRYKLWSETTAVLAVKTFAQSLVALIGAASVNVINLPWGDYLGIAAAAGVVCVLHNITSLPDPVADVVGPAEPQPVLVPVIPDPPSSSPAEIAADAQPVASPIDPTTPQV